MLCETNEDLKERLEDQIKETTRRDGLAKEWEDTLSHVNVNIRDLNLENEGLKSEREDLFKRIDTMQSALEEADNLRMSLDKQLDLVDKLRIELQQVQNNLLERSEEVNEERKENDRIRRLLDLTDNNLREQLKEQDKLMKIKVNEMEALLTDKHKVEMDQFKEEMLRSLEKMEKIKSKTDEEFLKVNHIFIFFKLGGGGGVKKTYKINFFNIIYIFKIFLFLVERRKRLFKTRLSIVERKACSKGQ